MRLNLVLVTILLAVVLLTSCSADNAVVCDEYAIVVQPDGSLKWFAKSCDFDGTIPPFLPESMVM